MPKDVSEGEVELAVYMNYPAADENTDTSIPQCLGVLSKVYSGEPVNMILDCTSRLSQVMAPNRPIQVSIVSKNGQDVRWDSAFISVYTSVDI